MSSSPDHHSRAPGGLAAFFVLPAFVAVLFGGGVALRANVPGQADRAIWTQLKVKAAFISRETTQKHKDAFSAPEFGWRILTDSGAVLARSALYGNLYYPADPAGQPADAAKDPGTAESTGVRLQLIERDIFQDDSVAIVRLQPGVSRYEFGSTGDYVELERSRFEPDRNSGADARPAGAVSIQGQTLAGSVDFRGADYTDYIRLPSQPGAVLILRENISLYWDLPGLLSVADVLAQRFPSPGSSSTESNSGGLLVAPRRPSSAILLHFADTAQNPRLLRLRAPIGGGQYRYRIFAAPATTASSKKSTAQNDTWNDDATRALLKTWLSYLRARNAQSLRNQQMSDPAAAVALNSIRRGNLAEALLARDAPGTAAVCRQRLGLQPGRAASFKSGSGADLERVFCAHLLYEHAAAADVDALLTGYANESEYYQEALRYVNRRAERDRSH